MAWNYNADFFSGASTPEKTNTPSGKRCPFISIALTAESNSANSSCANLMLPAALFSIMCCITVVPGIGTIQGFCPSSHARAICAGVAFLRVAQVFIRSTSFIFAAKLSGENLGVAPRGRRERILYSLRSSL